MIDGKSVLAIIPARGGSKGIPRKNILQIRGKPLIAWTIEAARESHYIDRLILSSEDPEIIEVAKNFGCEVPFVRPIELAGDDVPGISPVLDAIARLPEYDYVVLLQPTSPLRESADIDSCIECCVRKNAPACVSVTDVEKSPYWMYRLGQNGQLEPLLNKPEHISRRQDLPMVYVLNGAIYVAESQWLQKTKNFLSADTIGYQMTKEKSLDIDNPYDLELFELALSRRN